MNDYCKQLSTLLCGETPVIVCIGTDLVGGDCLGPLVGKMLVERNVPTYVYGTFSFLVNAKNVDFVGKFVKSNHLGKKILAIDSSVGQKEDVGKISVSRGAILPASARGKSFSPLGDYNITAVTCAHSPSSKEFSAVRLGFVFDLAKTITDIVCSSLSPVPFNNLLRLKN